MSNAPEKNAIKTDDLIRLIASDTKTQSPAVASALALAWAVGLAVSTAIFLVMLGFRPDLSSELGNWRFMAKVIVVWTAVAVSAWDCVRLTRPTETTAASGLNWIVAGLLFAALLLEMTTLPGSEWSKSLIGENWPYCLAYIPTLALAPVTAAFVAFRSAAPASPSAAGAALGRLGAATGAGLYALHCPDDSPFFVLAWYGIASFVVTVIAAITGARLLRW